MKRFRLRLSCRGSVLIGGHASVPDGLHGMHATDGQRSPILPATALRGALRETLEALLRGADQRACDGGNGREPSVMGAEALIEPGSSCALDDGRACVTCRLFGGGRETLAPSTRAFSALVLGDGKLVTKPQWTLRPGVSIARRARSAEENRLFIRRTPATGAIFEAEGRLLDETLLRPFEAAVRATTHLGSGRSRGFARVDMTLTWDDSATTAPVVIPETGDLRVRVTLQTPTILGVGLARENLRDTRREVPGAALRGAIGFALAETLQDPDTDAAFQDLVAEGKTRFGFLYPVDPKDARSDAPTGRLPITSVACKFKGPEHDLLDTLLHSIALEHVLSADDIEKLGRVAHADRCPKRDCDAPLRSVEGYRRCSMEPVVRAVTRAAIERTASSAREGALFTEVRLEPGAVFEGTIRCIPDGSRALLARALGAPLSIGRARGAGRGQVQVEVSALPPRPSVLARGERFDEALTRSLRARGMPTERVGRLIPIALLSPWIPPEQGDEWDDLATWFPGATCFLRARRFTREGTWDQRERGMLVWQAVTAGAVYVIELPCGARWRDHAATIEKMEREGVGRQRHQGYGEAYAFDPMFTADSTRREA